MSELFGPLTPALLIAMIAGLVELFKKFGLGGNGPLIASVSLGVFFGVLFQIMEMYPGVFSIWAQVGIYGVLFGLATSGLFVLGKNMIYRLGSALSKR